MSTQANQAAGQPAMPQKRAGDALQEQPAKTLRTGKDEVDALAVPPAEIESKFATSPDFFKLLISIKAESFAVAGDPTQNPIFVCERADKVTDVWRGLIEKNFLACPVMLKDEKRYYGFIDLADIARYVVYTFDPTYMNQNKDFWDLVKEEKHFQNKTIADVIAHPHTVKNPFHPVPRGYSAFAVFEPMAREKGLHRVPVVDPETRQLYNLVTQSQIVNFLYANINLLGNKKNKPMNMCQKFFKQVHCVSESEPAIKAFQMMVEKGIQGVGVIDSQGCLTGNLSVRDLKLISSDARLFWRLHQTVSSFLAKLRAEYQTKHGRPAKIVVATPTESLSAVVREMSDNHVHRVYLVDGIETMRPIGLVSIKDLLNEIIS